MDNCECVEWEVEVYALWLANGWLLADVEVAPPFDDEEWLSVTIEMTSSPPAVDTFLAPVAINGAEPTFAAVAGRLCSMTLEGSQKGNEGWCLGIGIPTASIGLRVSFCPVKLKVSYNLSTRTDKVEPLGR